EVQLQVRTKLLVNDTSCNPVLLHNLHSHSSLLRDGCVYLQPDRVVLAKNAILNNRPVNTHVSLAMLRGSTEDIPIGSQTRLPQCRHDTPRCRPRDAKADRLS